MPQSLRVISPGRIVGLADEFADGNCTITAQPQVFRDKAVEIIGAAWRELRESKTPEDRMWVLGQIEAFHALKVIDDFDYKGWLLKIETCPGHADQVAWIACAYCGINPLILL